jgi:aminoglycoside 3-N-acetyltransferase
MQVNQIVCKKINNHSIKQINQLAELKDFLKSLGITAGMHIMLHGSYRRIRTTFPGVKPNDVIKTLQLLLTRSGSLIMPVFTYCFRKITGKNEIYDQKRSPSKVGVISEVFRTAGGVVRTASPTHSFCLWGLVKKDIDKNNAPGSPLGAGSVLEWLAQQQEAYILLVGTDFRALSFGHYIEIKAKLPWIVYSPWEHLGVEPIAVSTSGEQKLIEVPGCSKSFKNFEKFLLQEHQISPFSYGKLQGYYLPVQKLLKVGLSFFSTHPDKLLCDFGTCPACDSRWAYHLEQLKKKQT